MTEHNGVQYLDQKDIKIIHENVATLFADEEPLPPFALAEPRDLEFVLQTIQVTVYGKELYPSLFMKAGILMYLINRKHIFLNGNKRMSVACVTTFLAANNVRFKISDEDIVLKALEIAKAPPQQQLDDVKQELSDWIERSTEKV